MKSSAHPSRKRSLIANEFKALFNQRNTAEYIPYCHGFGHHIAYPNKPVPLYTVPYHILHIQVTCINGGIKNFVYRLVIAGKSALVFIFAINEYG